MILADRTTNIAPPGTSAMRELANDLKRSGVDVINFAAGELDCDASDLMKLHPDLPSTRAATNTLPHLESRSCGKKLRRRFPSGAAFPIAPMKMALPRVRSKRFTTQLWSYSTREMKSSFHNHIG